MSSIDPETGRARQLDSSKYGDFELSSPADHKDEHRFERRASDASTVTKALTRSDISMKPNLASEHAHRRDNQSVTMGNGEEILKTCICE
jgi:hypothetical protein